MEEIVQWFRFRNKRNVCFCKTMTFIGQLMDPKTLVLLC